MVIYSRNFHRLIIPVSTLDPSQHFFPFVAEIIQGIVITRCQVGVTYGIVFSTFVPRYNISNVEGLGAIHEVLYSPARDTFHRVIYL